MVFVRNKMMIFLVLYLNILLCYTRKFYRTPGVQSHGAFLKNVTSASSEDCLQECFIAEGCKSFNTFEVESGKQYTCQLLSNDRCVLDEDIDISKNHLASVYFSTKLEHCERKLKIVRNRGKVCVKMDENKTIEVTERDDDLTNCDIFTIKNDQVTWGDVCIILLDNRVISTANKTLGECLKIIIHYGSKSLLLKDDSSKCLVKSYNGIVTDNKLERLRFCFKADYV